MLFQPVGIKHLLDKWISLRALLEFGEDSLGYEYTVCSGHGLKSTEPACLRKMAEWAGVEHEGQGCRHVRGLVVALSRSSGDEGPDGLCGEHWGAGEISLIPGFEKKIGCAGG